LNESAAIEQTPADDLNIVLKRLKDLLLPARGASGDSEELPSLADWFEVAFDNSEIRLSVSPPNRSSWNAQIKWERIIRICFKAGDLYTPDEIYIFTDERPESFLIPIEASGGSSLWDELMRRGLFDAELAIQAAMSTNKLYCCPKE